MSAFDLIFGPGHAPPVPPGPVAHRPEPEADDQADDQAEATDWNWDRVPDAARMDPDLSATAYRVLAAVISYCWADSSRCWASNRNLGDRCGGLSTNRVRIALAELVERGYLTRVDDPLVRSGRVFELARRLK